MATLTWTKKLSSVPLCIPPEMCPDDYMVNAAAISDDGSRVVGATYYQHYEGTTRVRVDGTFGTYVYDTAGTGPRLMADEYAGDKGIYAVAISGDGLVAAGGGLLSKGRRANPFRPKRGLLRAFDVVTHATLLDTSDLPDRINSVALSRDGGVLAAVGESTLYVFLRNAAGMFPAAAHEVDLHGYCETVTIHPSGRWIAAADQTGRVYVVTIAGGVVSAPVTWTARERSNPASPTSRRAAIKFHSVGAARVSDRFAAGGGSFVYLFDAGNVAGGPLGRFTTFDATGHHNVRCVAIADDGSFITTVVNDEDAAGNGVGRLIKVSGAGPALTKDWEAPLRHLPNTTGIDSSGTKIVAADGYPDNVPGTFYLFDQLGTKLFEHHTAKMNWPVAISANGTAFVGGSDDNTLFFFTT
jgi:WD40 repeat protein